MATTVENRQFHHEHGLSAAAAVVRSCSPNHQRADSPIRGCNYPAARRDVTTSRKVAVDMYDTSDDEEDEVYYSDVIKKSNSELESSVIDRRDASTADHWIERNPSMVRLTGKHPFNSEPPLTKLMQQGFITPAALHYVRNHGPVPNVSWDDWTMEVCGMVKRPARFTISQLVKEFPSREFPATLVCAGNRRTEQNLTKQTIGFNWGAAGISTSVWKGVPLVHILKRCGVYSRKKGALNVCFEGAEDLPGGGGSKYGTSISIEKAMDPARDIILAYMQNGEKLLPDHGFPVRMIIPGFIGGRMVKWLKRIIVTTSDSENYYHYKDNRVFPSHVDAELANSEGWWYKSEYLINELNINSVITTPCHQEILPINSWTTQRPYTLRGYAYSGGGKKVTRVEVTMDGGDTWRICKLDHKEKPNKYGKYWCWCFWSLEVEVLDLLCAKEVAVRAWDETLNTQPEKLIWNLMGMMNNCWFRVKTNMCKPHKGEIGIVFEHPTQPGNQSGGWMAHEKHLEMSSDSSNQTLKKSVSYPFMTTTSLTFSMSDVKKHNSADSAWIVVHVGSSIDIKGPLGHIEYTGKGAFSVHGEQKFAKKLAMFAGGTGITPIYQVMQAILKDPEDDTKMYLVYANRTEDDILLRDELDAWGQKYKDRVKVWYVVGRSVREGWKYSEGFINEDIMREHVPEVGEDTLALACGPPPMIQFAISPNLEKMGYDIKNSLLVF
ncbi:hypothetical protein L1987_46627 [Smallanthus sonchifolius]|uniref:Uncharacterized protein n=2 Tax=Smallanthus sonchifolius TaxID=185202 RepID=A0ACB9G0V8_9ASTR|nr:hypothetical protein L1987_46623 [Smallanthus sonchifolius]KAI3776837.1 hypothetical protein L1987_46627 [Smallanthus sonchifolius]